ncbi:MAG: 50S ribosomal protein L7/L12 [Clostridia bacterium]|nr:50S ribosomal protein L7/L12 [Clostridia bacterium]MDD4275959.1 50S ribosomal protein L7/L12 [Clostridia bacterium]
MDIKSIVAEIKSLTLLEVSELVKALETEFGVSATTSVAAPVANVAVATTVVEEKTEFTIALKEVGPNKIAVIKAVREITGLGLSEAKAVVDSAPSTVKDNVPTADAKLMVEKLKEAGAVAEMK